MTRRDDVLRELDEFKSSGREAPPNFCRMAAVLRREVEAHGLDPSHAEVFASALDPQEWERHLFEYFAGRRGKLPDVDLVLPTIEEGGEWAGIRLLKFPHSPRVGAPLKEEVVTDVFVFTEEGLFDSSDDFAEASPFADEIERATREAITVLEWLETTVRRVC